MLNFYLLYQQKKTQIIVKVSKYLSIDKKFKAQKYKLVNIIKLSNLKTVP